MPCLLWLLDLILQGQILKVWCFQDSRIPSSQRRMNYTVRWLHFCCLSTRCLLLACFCYPFAMISQLDQFKCRRSSDGIFTSFWVISLCTCQSCSHCFFFGMMQTVSDSNDIHCSFPWVGSNADACTTLQWNPDSDCCASCSYGPCLCQWDIMQQIGSNEKHHCILYKGGNLLPQAIPAIWWNAVAKLHFGNASIVCLTVLWSMWRAWGTLTCHVLVYSAQYKQRLQVHSSLMNWKYWCQLCHQAAVGCIQNAIGAIAGYM